MDEKWWSPSWSASHGPGLSRHELVALVRADQRPIIIQVEMKSSLRLAAHEIEVWDLRLGDRVTVAYQAMDGRNIARTITVER